MKHYNPALLLTLILSPTLALGSCDRDEPKSTTETTSARVAVGPIENAAMSARDISGAPSPEQQGTDPNDLETTRLIRNALTDDDTLSPAARNVKIVTRNGTVILRGAVRSATERANIEAKALHFAGMNDIDNELVVEGVN
jgi:osmotically-inducible protein OsmY